jgi:hypothetical protein
MCANALSQRGGLVFDRTGNNPNFATTRIPNGSTAIPAKNPARNLRMPPLFLPVRSSDDRPSPYFAFKSVSTRCLAQSSSGCNSSTFF